MIYPVMPMNLMLLIYPTKNMITFFPHCLEHLNDWVGALNHWTTRLHKGGILFYIWPLSDPKILEALE